MKNKILLLTFLFFSIISNSQKTEIKPIEANNSSSSVPIIAYKTPMNSYANYSFSQSIYLASDIKKSGEITKIAFHVKSDPTLNDTWKHWQIGMAHIEKKEFENVSTSSYSPKRYVSFDNIVNVFDGNILYDQSKKVVSITLSKPFQYDGKRNLVIEVSDKSAGKYTENIFFETKTYNNVMSVGDADRKDHQWNFRGKVKTPSNVPVITITIDPSKKKQPTEPQNIKVNTGDIVCGNTNQGAPAKYKDYNGNNSWVNMLYDSSKMKRAGKINKIAFFTSCRVSGACTYDTAKNQKIYMKEVDYTTHTSSLEPVLDSSYKLVYDGSITWKESLDIEGSENIITLNEPFNYSGNKTLSIYFLNENNTDLGGSLANCYESPYFARDMEENTVLYENFGPYTHNNGSTGINPKKGKGKMDKTLPVMRIYYDNTHTSLPSILKSTITANKTEILADGLSKSTITLQLYDDNGTIITTGGHNVNLITNVGTLSKIKDNKNGSYTATLTSSSIEETAIINGTLNSKPISNTATVKFYKNKTKILASKDEIIADGKSTSIITVEIYDNKGNKVSTGGRNVQIKTDKGNITKVTDNGDGTYTANLTSSTNVEVATVTATVDGQKIDSSVNVSFKSPTIEVAISKTTITASPKRIPADGQSQSTITLTVYDTNGKHYTKGDLNISFKGSNKLTNFTNNKNGTYTIICTSELIEKTVHISATINGEKIQKEATINFFVKTDAPENENEGITVGESLQCGSSSSFDAPAKYNGVLDKKNSWTTMLYRASTIKASGEIRSIAFFTSCRNGSACNYKTAQKQKIYMKEVEFDKFDSSKEPNLSEYDLVYDGSVTWKSGLNIENSKTIIKLDKPFTYSGKKNLAIYYLNENNEELGSFSNCGESPSFLWDYRGKQTVIKENFKENNKTGNGTYDTALPIVRLYFNNLNIIKKYDVDKVVITASQNIVRANGLASSIINVIMYNEDGEKLNYNEQSIELQTTLGTLGTSFIDNNGNYAAHLSSKNEGTAIVTGTFNKNTISSSVSVTFSKNAKPNEIIKNNSISFNQAFSPNGDSKNDTWVLLKNINIKYPKNKLKVYNRHGNLVYKASPYKNDWDGTSNTKLVFSGNKKLPVGVYYFIFDTGNDFTQDGWLYINY